jgi:hypothetical protein
MLSKTMRKIGWLTFALMWIPFLSLIGLTDGDHAWAELPMLTRYSLMISGVLGVVSTLLLVGAPIVSAIQNHAILANGLLAQATIIRVFDTGTTINNDPVVRLLLEVKPPDQPTFQAETERLVSRLHIPQVQPGSIVQVKYNPVSHAVALLDKAV